MKLREVTRTLISRLEEKSGYMVTVREDPSLSVLATIRTARANIPFHVLTYKSGDLNESPDYIICWQCAISTRMYECPPNQRFLITGTEQGSRELDTILNSPKGIAKKLGLSDTETKEFRNDLLSGIITHLRSVPIGLRVSAKLTLEFPELLPYEESHVEKEIQIGRQSLDPSIKQTVPPEVYNASQAISAAYALYWSGRMEKPSISRPFDRDNYSYHGQKLLDIMNQIPDEPVYDNDLIDRWADYLGIRNWYTWATYKAP